MTTAQLAIRLFAALGMGVTFFAVCCLCAYAWIWFSMRVR